MQQKTPIHTVGIDEVGRGCLAGPVVACAVIWSEVETQAPTVADSKKLSDIARRKLANQITQGAEAWGIGICNASEIDSINIRQASLLAMRRAMENCPVRPQYALVDGHDDPKLAVPTKTIIQGDAQVPIISCASIVAKVFRDNLMIAYAQELPGYAFEKHKGYGTQQHLAALQTMGLTPIHRRSFKPVHEIQQQHASTLAD